MTSKESLRNLKQEILTPNYLTDYEKDECIDVIQQELERLKKLEEAIEILKDKFYLRVHSNMFGSWLFIKEKTKHGEDVSCQLDLDIVDTIKEVLGNE